MLFAEKVGPLVTNLQNTQTMTAYYKRPEAILPTRWSNRRLSQENYVLCLVNAAVGSSLTGPDGIVVCV